MPVDNMISFLLFAAHLIKFKSTISKLDIFIIGNFLLTTSFIPVSSKIEVKTG